MADTNVRTPVIVDGVNVAQPNYYVSATGLEVIDVIKAFTADLVGMEAVYTANIIKYILRWPHKNGIQDIEKLMQYSQRLLDHLKEKKAKQRALLDKHFNLPKEEKPDDQTQTP